MRIAVLGTGNVGQILGARLVGLGHQVRMGARDTANPKAVAWAQAQGASAGTFADAAAFGELVFVCVAGAHALAALEAAGADNLAGKVLIDVSNPLDFSKGMPPSLTVANTDSLGEQLQRAFPAARIVKALNTMSAHVMVEPARVPGPHEVLIAGDDADAKAAVRDLLGTFGWTGFVDLGGISASRGLEAWLLLWIRLWGALGTSDFNLHLARA